MKTTLRFKVLGILIALLLGIFTSSCTKDEPISALESEITEDLLLKNGTISQPSDDVMCDLTAGQNQSAGQVIFSHDDDYLYVTYLTSNGWTLSEVHLYVGTLDGLPMNNTAVKIGQFPYSASDLNGLTTYTFDVPLAGLEKDENGYAIFAHAVVTNGEQEETAWSNCTYKPLITLKSKFTDPDFTYETWTWAATDGEHFSSDWYCTWLGTNIYEKDDEYMLQSWIYPASGGGAGKVEVTDDGINLYVTVTPKEGLTLVASYLFVGSSEELQSIDQPIGTCPNYYTFPYQNFDATPTHLFIIPIPMLNSISFESQFQSNRWGWFSYYNF